MDGLELTRHGAVLAVRIDRGETNAFSGAMIDALADAVADGARDAGLRFVHVAASGPVFCLGRDRDGETPDELRAEAMRIARLNETLRTSRLVVVCELSGDAAGFGAGIAAGADVTIASTGARLWFPELEGGLPPTVVLSWLTALVPPKVAFALAATGRKVEAAEALRLGLVTEVVAAEDVPATARAWLERLGETNALGLADVKSFMARCRELSEPAASGASADALAIAALRLRS